MVDEINALIIDDIDSGLHLERLGRYQFSLVKHLLGMHEVSFDSLLRKLIRLEKTRGFALPASGNSEYEVGLCLINAHLGEGERSKIRGLDLLWRGIRLNRNESVSKVPTLIYSTEGSQEMIAMASRSRFGEDVFSLPLCRYFNFSLRNDFSSSLEKTLDTLLNPIESVAWTAEDYDKVTSIRNHVCARERAERLGNLIRDLHHYLNKKIPYKQDTTLKVKTQFHKVWLRGLLQKWFGHELAPICGVDWDEEFPSQKGAIITSLHWAEIAELPREINQLLKVVLDKLLEIREGVKLRATVPQDNFMVSDLPALTSQFDIELGKISRVFLPIAELKLDDPRLIDTLIGSEYSGDKIRTYWEGRLSLELLLWKVSLLSPKYDRRYHVNNAFIEIIDPAMELLEIGKKQEVAGAFAVEKIMNLGIKTSATIKDLFDEISHRVTEEYGCDV